MNLAGARTRRLLICGFFPLFMGEAPSCVADSVCPPYTYAVTSENGAFVFVMIAPVGVQADVDHWLDPRKSEIRRLRSTYAASGMYPNDGSSKALWTVDWYSYDALPCNDGLHLIRGGPWPRDTREEAVSFFCKDALLRQYRICDLVDLPVLLPHSVSHFTWSQRCSLDNGSNSYSIMTETLEMYTFDTSTGKMTMAIRIPRLAFAILLTCLGIQACVRHRKRLYALWRKARRGEKSGDSLRA